MNDLNELKNSAKFTTSIQPIFEQFWKTIKASFPDSLTTALPRTYFVVYLKDAATTQIKHQIEIHDEK